MKKAYVHPTAIIDKTAVIGDDTKVWHFVHIREKAGIGERCILGDYVYVGQGVKIGNGVKLENRATVYRGVEIEDNVFVGPHVTFTNDPYPRSFGTDWKVVTTMVKEGASIGAGAVVKCGVTIGEYAMIGAGSIVTKDVPSHAVVYGDPAKVRGFACRCGRRLKEEKKKRELVSMLCPFCGKKYEISAENYAKIRKNER